MTERKKFFENHTIIEDPNKVCAGDLVHLIDPRDEYNVLVFRVPKGDYCQPWRELITDPANGDHTSVTAFTRTYRDENSWHFDYAERPDVTTPPTASGLYVSGNGHLLFVSGTSDAPSYRLLDMTLRTGEAATNEWADVLDVIPDSELPFRKAKIESK